MPAQTTANQPTKQDKTKPNQTTRKKTGDRQANTVSERERGGSKVFQ